MLSQAINALSPQKSAQLLIEISAKRGEGVFKRRLNGGARGGVPVKIFYDTN